jgi:hypothetical protein
MKKILGILVLITIVSGCALLRTNTSPKRAVETLLGKYQQVDNEILTQLDDLMADEDLTTAQQVEYRKLMRKQFESLTYTIKDEVIDGENALVTVEIEVYDLGKAQADIERYLDENRDEFLDDEGVFVPGRFTDYRIERLMEQEDRIKYTLDLRLTRENEEWRLDDLTEVERQKIHGIYVGT